MAWSASAGVGSVPQSTGTNPAARIAAAQSAAICGLEAMQLFQRSRDEVERTAAALNARPGEMAARALGVRVVLARRWSINFNGRERHLQ